MTNTPEDKKNNTSNDTKSKVSQSKKKNIAIIALFVISVAIVFFYFLSGDNKELKPNQDENEPVNTVNVSKETLKQQDIPKPIKKIEKKTTPEPIKVTIADKPTAIVDSNESVDLPTLPAENNEKVAIPVVKYTDNNDKKLIEKKNIRLKSSIMLINNSTATEASRNANIEKNVDVVYQGDTSYLLSYGKIISAVLESALNSDFKGEARAIITEDVFAQSGRKILIPKGSRVIGNYSVFETSGYGRMHIAWNSIYLPNGYVVNLSQSIAIDNLGIPGVEARVDDKAFEKILNTVLVSGFSIGVAKGLDRIDPPKDSHNINKNTAKSQALLNYSSSVMNNPNLTSQAKIQMLCSSIYNYMDDPTSPTYQQIQQNCNQINLNIGGATPEQQLATLMSTINTAALSLTKDSVQDAQPTKTEQATKDAYQNITNTLKDMVSENNFKTVITVPQGKEIKIYVNKPIVFPKESVNKSRFIQ